jgi:hypothetical protein
MNELEHARENLEAAQDDYVSALVTAWEYADSLAYRGSILDKAKYRVASRKCQEARVIFLAAQARLTTALEGAISFAPITVRAREVKL